MITTKQNKNPSFTTIHRVYTNQNVWIVCPMTGMGNLSKLQDEDNEDRKAEAWNELQIPRETTVIVYWYECQRQLFNNSLNK